MKIISLIIILISLNSIKSNAQINSKLKLSYSYFEQGDYENSARMFKEIIDSYPKSFEALVGYTQSLKNLNKYSELAEYLQSVSIDNSFVNITLAEMYWRTGKIDKAEKLWKKTVDNFSKDINIYQNMYESFIELQLFNKAISTLKTARNNLKDKRLFSNEIIKLLIAIGNYQDGLEEILNELYLNRNLPITQGRIYALMGNLKAKKYIKSRLEEEANKKKSNILTQTTLAWFYRTVKNYEDAFNLIVRIDNLKKSRGRTIFNFAEQSRKDFQTEIAQKAYELIIDTKKYNKYKNQSMFGYAQTLEQIMKKGNKVDNNTVYKIINRYQDIINSKTGPKAQADANYRVAQLYRFYLYDYDKAKKYLEVLVRNYINYESGLKAALDLSMIYLFDNNINKSINLLSNMKKSIKNKFKDYKNIADFQLAKLYYYTGKIDSANNLFIELSGKVKSAIGNDAIDYAFFLDNNKDYREMIIPYAKAELLELKNDKIEAMNIYKRLSEFNKKTEISRKSQLKYCQYLFDSKNYKKVITRLELFIDDQFDFIEIDKTIILLADAYFQSGNSKKAIETLTKILINNPNSIYIQKVRDSIRKYRGES